MRLLSLPAPILAILSAFCSPSTSLPVADEGRLREGRFHALRPRYSVVPIDGGTSPAQAATTIIETVTSSPKTETVTASAGDATETVTAIATDISVVSIQPAQTTAPPVTIVETHTVTDDVTPTTAWTSTAPPPVATPTPPITSPSHTPTQPASPSSSTPPSTSTPEISTAIVSATISATISASTSSESLAPCPTSSTPPSPYTFTTFTTSSTSYDDGQWHTTYPAWNGTSSYRRARR